MEVKLFDTTLRDGTQGEGLSISVEDKLRITQMLDRFGVHYVEGGWPASNPKDAEFFGRARRLRFRTARLTAFGSTRKARGRAEEDVNLRGLLEADPTLRQLVNLGFTDAFRSCNAQLNQYTFWDYQAGAWQKNNGLRIDHLLLSPQAADRLKTCAIDKHTRAWEKPSDHVPIWCELAL